MTAIERFAKVHDEGDLPEQAKYYQDLIPLTLPQEGEQFAFDVDLDKCSGCKACVSACHSLNGLEEDETWRSVGQLYGENGLPIIQHVTTACHHCVNPGCLNGCPTNAYEKDPVTGIVRHLDDQCFGCQYCTMACPYEVPQYSSSKGIVRKCDMCHSRLSEGEAPACVQACPNQAISISIVNVAETIKKTNEGIFLPATPPAELTNPTTVYHTERSLPADLKGADTDYAAPQHAHLPLVVMLVLTQMSVGAVAFGAIARWRGYGLGAELAIILGTVAGLAGLGVAPLHLGRPHLAYRAILGWRHSWLSREALVFGVYAPLAILSSLYVLLPYGMPWLSDNYPDIASRIEPIITLALPTALRPVIEIVAILAGAAGVYCSGMIYVFTGRQFWLGLGTGAKFGGTPWVLGTSLSLATICCYSAWMESDISIRLLALLLIAFTAMKLSFEYQFLAKNYERDDSHRLTKKIMLESLKSLTFSRFTLGLIGGILLPIAALVMGASSWLTATIAIVGIGCLLLGELAERALYFSAVIPLRMPGGVKP